MPKPARRLSAAPSPEDARALKARSERERWLGIVETRLANVLHALDILEQACVNRERYGEGVRQSDIDEITGPILEAVKSMTAAFNRGSRRPVVKLTR